LLAGEDHDSEEGPQPPSCARTHVYFVP
jgi:hypothetical protein